MIDTISDLKIPVELPVMDDTTVENERFVTQRLKMEALKEVVLDSGSSVS
jgi:hypothetical protein